MVWSVARSDKIDSDLLNALFDNDIAGIVVPDFLAEPTRTAALAGILRNGLDYYRDVHPPVGRIGITQYEHRHDERSREDYFAAARAANQLRREVFAESGDLLTMIIDALDATWPGTVSLAHEDDREYFAGLVRVIGQGLLHCDWAPHDGPGWSIGSVDAQVTWNIFCQVSGSGGAARVYDRPWYPGAESAARPDSYAYDEVVVSGHRCVSIAPEAGALVLFNSRNFHSIDPSTGPERVSVSSFVGRAGSDLMLWS